MSNGATKLKLQTVVELIIEQRLEMDGDIFMFDTSILKQKLKETKNYSKYGLNYEDLRKILDRIVRDGIIQLDYLTDDNRWKYGFAKEWDVSRLIPVNDNYDEMLLGLFKPFIYVRFDDIGKLKVKYDLPFDAELKLSVGEFVVICDNKRCKLSTLDAGTTYDILKYAWENPNREVSYQELVDKGVIGEGYYEKSLTKIFKRNTLVKEVLTDFISISKSRIMIKRKTEILLDKFSDIMFYALENGIIKE